MRKWIARMLTAAMLLGLLSLSTQAAEPAGEKALADCPFTDVQEDSPICPAVSWAAEQGIIPCTGDGTAFDPGETCTRGEIAVFLYRAAGAEAAPAE